ncbi:MAG: YqgE/AlgH family protein [Pseudomonadota bacterium]
MTVDTVDLTGKLLVAMPGMGDPRFTRSVVYICAHDADGSMGLIVNKPQQEVDFSNLLEELEIKRSPKARDIRVHFGGPVELGRGFVLHSSDYLAGNGTLQVDDDIGMTATLEVLEDLAQGKGPKASMLALGYAGWGPGQLEREIGQNGWLVCDPRHDIIFGRANEHKWTGAMKMMGIDPLLLSETAGRA